MSCFKNGQYYVLISSSNKTRKLLRVFATLHMGRILAAAEQFGIYGRYLVSAEDNVIIADSLALHHYIQKGHMIMVLDSLEDHVKYVKLEEIGESETDVNAATLEECKEEQYRHLKHISSQLGHVESSLSEFVHQFN